MVSPARLCIICKGTRMLCGAKSCPLLVRMRVFSSVKVEKSFFGPSPLVFVGRANYPNVFVGPLASVEENNIAMVERPSLLYGMPYNEVVRVSSSVLRGMKSANVKKPRDVERLREISMSIKPVDIEMEFGRVSKRFSFSTYFQPIGISTTLKRFMLAGNPKIPRIVDEVSSGDVRAEEAVGMLYRKGIDVYKISSILSTGVLGLEKRKKLVPTRWSITATDDMVFRKIVERIKKFKPVEKFMVYRNSYLNNRFTILLMPGKWEFENFEAWAPGSFWARKAKDVEIIEEYEGWMGRKNYAKQGGGYYASRLGVAEGLLKLRRQARVVVFREIDEGYVLPMGVWVVRETVRNAFSKKPLAFDDLEGALHFVSSQLRIDIKKYKNESKILGQMSIYRYL